MSRTPPDLVKTTGTTADLVDRLTISGQGTHFRVELVGDSGGGAAGAVARSELQRILQMLQGEVVKAGWLAAPANAPGAPAAEDPGPKPARH
jgi:NAD(P)H-dependent FMN reductase